MSGAILFDWADSSEPEASRHTSRSARVAVADAVPDGPDGPGGDDEDDDQHDDNDKGGGGGDDDDDDDDDDGGAVSYDCDDGAADEAWKNSMMSLAPVPAIPDGSHTHAGQPYLAAISTLADTTISVPTTPLPPALTTCEAVQPSSSPPSNGDAALSNGQAAVRDDQEGAQPLFFFTAAGGGRYASSSPPSSPPPSPPSRRRRGEVQRRAWLLPLLGVSACEVVILCLFATAFTITPGVDGFPFPWSMPAVAAALGYIALGTPSIVARRSWGPGIPSPLLNGCFGSFLPAYIGRLSYPLYLWHWPIFVGCRWTVGLNVSRLVLPVPADRLVGRHSSPSRDPPTLTARSHRPVPPG